jgi:hypothetical protein
MIARNVAHLEDSLGYFGGKEALAHLKWMCQGVAVITNGMYVCLPSACSNLANEVMSVPL